MYQVTGPVLEVTESVVVLKKVASVERWRDANTKPTPKSASAKSDCNVSDDGDKD